MSKKKELKRIGQEFSKLFFCWKEFINTEVLLKIEMKKILYSLGIGFTVFMVGSAGWWVTRSLYAQSYSLLEETGVRSAYRVFPWVVTGGLVSIVVSIARSYYGVCKRCFDVVVATIGLIVFSPLFLFIAVLIKLDSKGPVFFRQERVVREGRLFNIFKFRTMRENAELETGPVWVNAHDPRITSLGRFLRKTHLDELPQLINVWKADMSLIGPQPERPEFVEIIRTTHPSFHQRLKVKPGMTGLAQVRYRYESPIEAARWRLKYDLLYIKKMCWFLDFKIILWSLGRFLTG